MQDPNPRWGRHEHGVRVLYDRRLSLPIHLDSSSAEPLRLKPTVLVKELGPDCAMVMDPTSDQIYECTDDLARLMVILFATTQGRSFAEIHGDLCARSERFRNNAEGEALLTEALARLREANFLDPSSSSSGAR